MHVNVKYVVRGEARHWHERTAWVVVWNREGGCTFASRTERIHPTPPFS